jgi:hypothetical protein
VSNPYFFVFFIMTLFVACPQGLQPVWAQTTKLTPELKSVDTKSTKKTLASPSKKSLSKKLQVDLSTVPDLGSVQTEAGVGSYAPGISNNYVSPMTVVPATTTSSDYQYSDQFNSNSTTNALTSVAGVMNIFGMAQTVGQRINPRAGVGPMFVNECKDCQTNAEVVGSGNVFNNGVAAGGGQSGHDPELILAIVKNETLMPFEGVEHSEAQGFVDGVITSLSKMGSLVLTNLDEYKQMCPTYESLNPNQRKAFMVFLFSSIYKQTSNYDFTKITNVTIQGKSSNRIGFCQLEYEVADRILKIKDLADKSAYESAMVNPYANISICTSIIYAATINQNTKGARPLKSLFPTVNFDQIGASLKNLNMCRGN